MEKTIERSRWANWESVCLEAAVKKGIQLKIISRGLEKSVSAINKKISALGLRAECMIATPPRIRPLALRTRHDIAQMVTILTRYAPYGKAQTRKNAFLHGDWNYGSAVRPHRPASVSCDLHKDRIERWAQAQGFEVTTGTLREKGYLFWKDGKHFSKAQMIMRFQETYEQHKALSRQHKKSQEIHKTEKKPT